MLLQSIIKSSFGQNKKFIKEYEQQSLIFKLFGGKLRSRVQCMKCEYKSDRAEPFLSLSLDITHHSKFEQCIQEFCKIE